MQKITFIIVSLLLITIFSGCNASQEAGQAVTTIMEETGEAYENTVTKINTTKNWFTTKVDQVDQAATDLGEAADSVGNAVDSLKELSNFNDPEKTGETNDPVTD